MVVMFEEESVIAAAVSSETGLFTGAGNGACSSGDLSLLGGGCEELQSDCVLMVTVSGDGGEGETVLRLEISDILVGLEIIVGLFVLSSSLFVEVGRETEEEFVIESDDCTAPAPTPLVEAAEFTISSFSSSSSCCEKMEGVILEEGRVGGAELLTGLAKTMRTTTGCCCDLIDGSFSFRIGPSMGFTFSSGEEEADEEDRVAGVSAGA